MTPSKAPTRRRHTVRGLRMAQNPHRSQPEVRRIVYKTLALQRLVRKTSPSTAPPPAFPRKNSPITPQNANFGPFFVRRANFVALTPTIRPAGRRISRIRSDNAATLKPTTPLLAPNKEPLKPASPLPPKNAPKTPVSHPQRRHRFQLRLDLRPQR